MALPDEEGEKTPLQASQSPGVRASVSACVRGGCVCVCHMMHHQKQQRAGLVQSQPHFYILETHATDVLKTPAPRTRPQQAVQTRGVTTWKVVHARNERSRNRGTHARRYPREETRSRRRYTVHTRQVTTDVHKQDAANEMSHDLPPSLPCTSLPGTAHTTWDPIPCIRGRRGRSRPTTRYLQHIQASGIK